MAVVRVNTSRHFGVQAIVERSGTGDKLTVRGTHRIRPPAETIAWARTHFSTLGITRVANVTGLDVIGIPVVMVARPNSRGLAVSQGKGITLDAAKASGIMESIEHWHGEHLHRPLWKASTAEVAAGSRIIDIERLPRATGGSLNPARPVLWVEGVDLLDGSPVWVPEEVVGMDCTLPGITSTHFASTSNGLASGNHPLEAITHALCEVIERDAKTLFDLLPRSIGRNRRLDLSTITNPDSRALIERCHAAGVTVAAWDATSDIGIPVVTCEIFDTEPNPFRPLPVSAGHGCHPSRDVAFQRALTEAAQSRLTYISGARDDNYYSEYAVAANDESLAHQRDVLTSEAPRSFVELPHHQTGSMQEDVELILDLLTGVGLSEVVVVDLTRPEFEIPVVRVIVPGLEHKRTGNHLFPPGPRAQSLVAELEAKGEPS